jgi:hypothetical protein
MSRPHLSVGILLFIYNMKRKEDDGNIMEDRGLRNNAKLKNNNK